MNRIKVFFLATVALLVSVMSFPVLAEPSMEPQYGTTDDSAGRTYTGYFIEDGKIKNTLIVIKLRRLRSYWDGIKWVECTSKIKKNTLSKTITDETPDDVKFLSKFPSYVTIEDKNVYFDPQQD